MSDEHVDILKKNEGPEPRKGFAKFARWAVAYTHSCGLDVQTFDIASEYDSLLTAGENKQAFKARHPAGAEPALAAIRLDEARAEASNRTAAREYVDNLRKEEDAKLTQMFAVPPGQQPMQLGKHVGTLRALVRNVMEGYSPALFILSAEPGIGKTHQVLEAIKEAGWTLEDDVGYFSGYCTPLSLYEFLYENSEKKLVVLDDLDQVYRNPIVLNMMKSATFGIPTRKVQYATTSKARKAPEEFEMKAPIIFIANHLPDNPQTKALLSRSLYLEITLTTGEKKEMLTNFALLSYKTTTAQQRKEALEFVLAQRPDAMQEFSFRLLQKVYALILQYPDAHTWQRLAREIISYDDDMLAWLTANEEDSVQAAVQKFQEMTGSSRASFFRLKRKVEFLREGKSLKSQILST